MDIHISELKELVLPIETNCMYRVDSMVRNYLIYKEISCVLEQN